MNSSYPNSTEKPIIFIRDGRTCEFEVCPGRCPRFSFLSISNFFGSYENVKTGSWVRFCLEEVLDQLFRACLPGLCSNLGTLLLDVNNIVSSAVQSAGCTLIKIFGINQIFVKFKIQIANMSHIYESRWTWEFDFDAVRWCFIDRCMYTVQTQVQRSF